MKRPPLDVDAIATVAAAASRVSNLGTGMFDAGRHRRGRVARAYHTAWILLSLVGLVDMARTRRLRRGWIVADAALVVATNLSRSSWDQDDTPVEQRFQQLSSLCVSAAATADFAPVAVVSTVTACAAWAWGLAGLQRRRGEFQVAVVAATLEPLLAMCAVAAVSRQLRSIETELDALREAARVDAETATVELERERTHRLLHDTVLQTLEAVSGDWHADDASLRSLAASDARWLRQALAEEDTRKNLEPALADLVETYRRAGLDVTLETRPPTGCAGTVAEELAAATREALTNVLKHAGPCTTRVAAQRDDATVSVTVTDDGCGFDTAAGLAGYGIENSIRRRLSAMGGDVVVRSSVGRGTVIRMSVPSG